MKKIVSILLSVLLLVGLGVNALAAEGFNAGLSVDRNTEGRIIVTVEDSQVLRDQKPRLSIPADETFAEAVVFLENVAETAEYANGMVTFTVYKGGSYCIAVEAELTDSVAATCTQEGRNEYLFDGNIYVETVPALEHDFTDTTRPTCANCEETNPHYAPPFVPTPPQDDSEDEEPSASFTDVEQDAWYVEAVDYVVEQKLFIGVSETEFAPQSTMTRAMFWMVLARMSGENVDCGEVWYEKAMEWAVENELSDGTGHADAVTREQIVTMLWRFAGSPSNSTEIGSFADADSVSDWAKEAMQWACGKGIVEGAGGYLLPGDSAERCQVAAMIMRYLENVVNA